MSGQRRESRRVLAWTHDKVRLYEMNRGLRAGSHSKRGGEERERNGESDGSLRTGVAAAGDAHKARERVSK